MSSLERAKRFVAQKAWRLALVVVPLAALTVSTGSAKATTLTFNPGSNCFASGDGETGSCQTVQEAATGGNPAANWVAMTGSATQSSSSGGAVNFTVSGSTNNGTIGAGTIPVAWNFSFGQVSVTDPTVNWTLLFQLEGSVGAYFETSGSTSTGDTVTGNGVITIPTSGTVSLYLINLLTSSSGEYTLTVPGSATLDLNPLAPAGVPEPATLFLLGPAAGALLLLRRRKSSTPKRMLKKAQRSSAPFGRGSVSC